MRFTSSSTWRQVQSAFLKEVISSQKRDSVWVSFKLIHQIQDCCRLYFSFVLLLLELQLVEHLTYIWSASSCTMLHLVFCVSQHQITPNNTKLKKIEKCHMLSFHHNNNSKGCRQGSHDTSDPKPRRQMAPTYPVGPPGLTYVSVAVEICCRLLCHCC